MKRNLLLLLAVLLATKIFSQSVLTFQPGAAGIDAHVDNLNASTVDVNYPVVNAGYNTVGGTPTLSHNFMQFDLSAIPTGSTIVSATLSLYHSTTVNHSLSSDNAELLAKVTQAWSEGTVTWNTQPTFSATDTIHIGTTNIGDDKPNIDLAAFVQDWVNTPAANYGMVMHLVDEPGSIGRFQTYGSSDAADSTIRPKLVVSFIPPCKDETTVLQPGSDGIDAHVDDLNSGTVDVNYPIVNAGYNTVGGTPTLSHNFMQFDLSAVPAGATVVSATLSLYHSTVYSHSTSTSNEELLAKVTQAWNENTITWNTQPTFSATDTIHIGNTTIGDDKTSINLAPFVQDWVNTPAANYGMVMHLVDEPGSLGRFQTYGSSDAADSTIRPKLVIVWNNCGTLGIDKTASENAGVSVYPNPVNDVLQIKTTTDMAVDAIVYDMLGNQISVAKNATSLNVKELTPGFYLVRLSGKNVSKCIKFIKQ